MYVFGHILIGLTGILDTLLFFYSLILLGSVILSWVNADPRAPLSIWITRLSRPVLMWLRRKIKTVYGQMDLTAFIAILVIMFIQTGILPAIEQFAAGLIH